MFGENKTSSRYRYFEGNKPGQDTDLLNKIKPDTDPDPDLKIKPDPDTDLLKKTKLDPDTDTEPNFLESQISY
jgi:hypothetical protein